MLCCYKVVLQLDFSLFGFHLKRMFHEIEKCGGHIDRIYYCTSLTEADKRRKPGIGMFEDILRDYPDVKPSGCLMIGDSDSDMKFAENCGIKGIKV